MKSFSEALTLNIRRLKDLTASLFLVLSQKDKPVNPPKHLTSSCDVRREN